MYLIIAKYNSDTLKPEKTATRETEVEAQELVKTLKNRGHADAFYVEKTFEHNTADVLVVDPKTKTVSLDQTVLDKKAQQEIELQDAKKRKAYQEEADPLFFKWQRGEAKEQDWLDKIAEIDARFA